MTTAQPARNAQRQGGKARAKEKMKPVGSDLGDYNSQYTQHTARKGTYCKAPCKQGPTGKAKQTNEFPSKRILIPNATRKL